MGKKKFMSPDAKANARVRKEPHTVARRKRNRDGQRERELHNKVQSARGVATPWAVACAIRAARRQGVSGAA